MSAPLVYRDLDQQALNAQYNNRERFPDYKERFNAWSELSAKTRTMLGGHLDVAFGPRPKEGIDIFPAEGQGAPIYVFVHGGYWYSLDKADCSYVAQGMRPHGVMTVVNNYDLAPTVDMDEIVRQNRAAIAWLYHHAAEYGGDPDRIYVCGHSAGGHLGVHDARHRLADVCVRRTPGRGEGRLRHQRPVRPRTDPTFLPERHASHDPGNGSAAIHRCNNPTRPVRPCFSS